MIITLTTDFGLSDPFVGIMKGVILGIAPSAQIVDLGHDIRSYDMSKQWSRLKRFSYFPDGTVHVVVVDPGVGSGRRPIAAAFQGHFFVGPGQWRPPAVLEQRRLSHSEQQPCSWMPVSRTFHGRDIFAPVAAHLAQGCR